MTAEKFSRKHRPTLTKVCACGCGETFKTTFPNKVTKDDAHRMRKSRMSRNALYQNV